jgi:alkanesulfonate monooxygenase SsuD/methylene tetrahydromethanopterin reductase-like flavin-dependent oxidoreductase (luciferase family)
MHAAWGSPPSVVPCAKLGLAPLVIPTTRGFRAYADELRQYYEVTSEHGHKPKRPTVVLWAYCAASKDAQEEAKKYEAAKTELGVVNYEQFDGYHQTVPGYEWWGSQFRVDQQTGKPEGNPRDYSPVDEMPEGTPDQCIERIQAIVDLVNPRQMIFNLKFGGMPYEVAERSIQLFAKEVLPFVHGLKEPPPPEVELAAQEGR